MPVMHTRKPIRASDGYFEKHQTHPHSYQSSKYSSRSTSYGRDRDRDSPIGMNGYRSVSPDIDSPRDRSDRDRDRGRYQSSNYLKRDRDYKKDKYVSSEKRGRERELDHRNNHDTNKRSKLSSKRDGSSSNSDDRDRGREREREPKREREHERERERDRGDRERDRDRERSDRDIKESSRSTSSNVLAENLTRVGDWSEHVSKSGKKYYYNCKTEVSQWDKPREWIEKERALTKELHRDSYRERDRERDKEDRYTSSSSRGNYGLHSRGNSRVRWTHDSDLPPASSLSHHRSRRHDEADMEISPDSTPTSEAGYSHHSSTPTATTNNSSVINISNNNLGNSEQSSSSNPNSYSGNALPRILSSSATNSSSSTPTSHNIMSSNVNASGSSHHHHHYHSTSSTSSAITHSTSHNSASSSNTNPNQLLSKTSVATASGISIGSPSSVYPHHIQTDAGLNSNAPGPPANGAPVLSGVGLPKILSHVSATSGKPLDAIEHQKSLLISRQHSASSLGTPGILEGSPIYNIVNHSNQQSTQHTPQHTTNYYSSSSNLVQQLSVRSDSGGNGTLAAGNNCIDGPPTPTQEKDLDIVDVMSDHRKLETSSSSLLNCVMTTVAQTSRSQGPNLTSSLANYCRLDLIQHIKDWPADYLEHQAKKCSEEAHYYSDIQCSQVSTELKCARSVVRLREIRAFLQEQKLMFLRQQIQRIEQLLSQNPYMSTESNDL